MPLLLNKMRHRSTKKSHHSVQLWYSKESRKTWGDFGWIICLRTHWPNWLVPHKPVASYGNVKFKHLPIRTNDDVGIPMFFRSTVVILKLGPWIPFAKLELWAIIVRQFPKKETEAPKKNQVHVLNPLRNASCTQRFPAKCFGKAQWLKSQQPWLCHFKDLIWQSSSATPHHVALATEWNRCNYGCNKG